MIFNLEGFTIKKSYLFIFIDDNFKILEYWSTATSFQHLQVIAQRILAIPASQATDERVFSSTGHTLRVG
jgi:hypothetical protein